VALGAGVPGGGAQQRDIAGAAMKPNSNIEPELHGYLRVDFLFRSQPIVNVVAGREVALLGAKVGGLRNQSMPVGGVCAGCAETQRIEVVGFDAWFVHLTATALPGASKTTPRVAVNMLKISSEHDIVTTRKRVFGVVMQHSGTAIIHQRPSAPADQAAPARGFGASTPIFLYALSRACARAKAGRPTTRLT
jgi:hypothetical protein